MSKLGRDSRDRSAQIMRPGTVHNITVGPTADDTPPMGDQTSIVRLCFDVAVRYRIGTPAVGTDTLLPANVVETISILPREVVSVIQDSAAGTGTVTEGA